MWAKAGAVWVAASTGFSAFLYLLDFGTTLSTLRTYYFYEYQCPHAPLASPALRDPLCRAMRYGQSLHGISLQFWICLSFLLLAHFVYAFVFWVSLDPRHHPLRLAYFLPVIHFYRLLKLFSHTLSCKDIKDLAKSQREYTSLFNAIGASVETAPQFCIQFVVAMKLGEHIKDSSDPNLQSQSIPTILMVSLVTAMLSGSYTMSMAVWSLMEKRMPLARRAFYCLLIGCQTLVAMLIRAMCIATLSQFSKTSFKVRVMIYDMSAVTISWLFIDFLLQSHQCNRQGKSKYLRVAHSFGLAVMTRLLGPIYVIVKFSKSSSFLIWGMLSHIFVDLIGAALVFHLPSYIKDQESPCHAFYIKSMELVEENHYLNCKVFLGTLLPSIITFILTTLLLYCLESGSNARDVPCTFIGNSYDSHDKSTFFKIFTVNRVDHRSRGFEEKNSHQLSAKTFFKLFLFVISILLIQKLQKKNVLKRPPLIL